MSMLGFKLELKLQALEPVAVEYFKSVSSFLWMSIFNFLHAYFNM